MNEPSPSTNQSAQIQAAELQAVLDSAVDAIITITNRGRIRSVNPSTEAMFGYQADEMLGKNIAMLMPEPYHSGHDSYLNNYAETKERKIIGIGREVLAKTKDGTVFPIDLAVSESRVGSDVFFTGIIRDLSHRHAIESQLLVQANAIESVSQGICIAEASPDPSTSDIDPTDAKHDDAVEFRIVTCNSAMDTITGLATSEIIGLSFAEFLNKLESASGNSDFQSSLLKSMRVGERGEARWQCHRANGTAFWNETTVAPVLDSQDRLSHFVAVISDVTEQQNREEQLETEVSARTKELENAQAQLVQQARLAMLGKISGGIAHEIRNPLNAIKTSAYFLLNAQSLGAEKQREHLERIDRQVGLIDGVVTVISDAARLPCPVRVATSVASLFDESSRSVSMPSSIHVQKAVPEDLSDVVVDAAQILIAFRNLLRNARDAMPDGGKLMMEAKVSEPNMIAFVFTDTGVGIPAETIERIREPLFTTKPHGMGLGLSISYAIIENNGGQITVTSSEGKGAVFTVSLPTSPVVGNGLDGAADRNNTESRS